MSDAVRGRAGTRSRFELGDGTTMLIYCQALCWRGSGLARWEKGKTEINGAADRLMRTLYLAHCGDVDVPELIKTVAALDAKIEERQVFKFTTEKWKAAA